MMMMSKVKIYRTKNGVKSLVKEVEMSQQQQDSFINYLDDHHKKARVDDLR